jgi:peptidoglycan/xylan/chitin deacetylase (PgdA/CDA1 family)
MMSALKEKQVAVFSVDLGIGDWEDNMTTGMLLARLLENLKATGGGIILMHDAFMPPAKAMPIFLRALKANGYKVVHVEWEQ